MCRADANPRPSKIQWFKEGDERFVQNGPTLRLNGVTAANNGRYICSAINHLRTSTKGELTRTGNATISLNIKHKPGRSNITPENPKVSWWIIYVLFMQCICTMRTKIVLVGVVISWFWRMKKLFFKKPWCYSLLK